MPKGPIDEAAVRAAVADFKDPETGRGVVEMEQIRDIEIGASRLSLTLELTTHSAPLQSEVRAALVELLQGTFDDLDEVDVALAVHQRPPQKLGEVGLTAKSVIAVGSGKGGVGKSTMAASLAYGLKRAGCHVGLLDADVYGPSIPQLTGVVGTPADVSGEKKLKPILSDGMPIMSMGFLVPPGEAVVWRGPMLHGAITQFLRDTDWGDLDYLIIDMPPGTGDIALTLAQAIPSTGAVVVCTPQDVALLDAVKAIAMFRKVKIPIIGLIENMSGFVCPHCQQRTEIFGSGGARDRAAQLEVPFLGEVPINLQIRLHGDAGKTDDNLSDPAVAPYLEKIIHQLAKNLADTAASTPPRPSLPVL